MKKVSINKISVEGYGSFIRQQVLDLDHPGVMTLMKGENGKGKTTLLGAVPYGLYGVYVKGLSAKKVVTWEWLQPEDFKGTRVIVYFTGCDGKDYVVARHIKYKGLTYGVSGKDELLLFKKVEVGYEQTEDRYKADRQAKIIKLMGMGADTFMQSYFFGQNLNRLINNKKEENQKLFEKLLEVHWVKQAKEKADTRKKELEKEVENLENQIELIITSVEGEQKILKLKEEAVAAFKKERKEKLEELNKKYAEQGESIERIEKQITENTKLFEKYDKEKLEQLEEKLEKLKKDTSEIDQLEEDLKKFKKSSKVEEMEEALEKLKKDTSSVDALEEEEEEKKQELAKKVKTLTASKDDTEGQIELCETVIKRFEKSEKNYEDEISFIKQKIKKLESKKDKVDTVCPVCNQEIPEKDVKEAKQELQKQAELEKKALTGLEKEVEKIVEKRLAEEKKKKKFQELIVEYKEELNGYAEEEDELESQYDELVENAEAKHKKAVKEEQGKFDLALKEYLEKLKKFDTSIKEAEEKKENSLKDTKSEIKEVEENNKTYKEAGDKLPTLKANLENTKENAKITFEELEKVGEKKPPHTEKDLEDIRLSIKKEIEKKVELGIDFKEKTEELDIVKWWSRTGFGANGVKAYVFSSGLQRLNEYIRKYADRLGYRVVFSIDTESTYKDFVTTVYYPHKLDDGKIIEYATEFNEFSGGEKQRIALAISFAMEDFVADDVSCNLVVKDEAFEGLDEKGREAAFDLLRLSAESGKSVWIITHSDLLDVKYAKAMYIDKDKNGSYVR